MRSIADRRHRVLLQNPGPSIPDPDGGGGYTQSWADLEPPTLQVAIEPATQQRLEAVGAGTVIAQATHIISAPYHPGITTKTRIVFDGRRFNVTGLADPGLTHDELIIVVAELTT